MVDLIRESATRVVSRLARNEVSPLELLDELEKRIGRIDPQVNAFPPRSCRPFRLSSDTSKPATASGSATISNGWRSPMR
jgi:amidase